MSTILNTNGSEALSSNIERMIQKDKLCIEQLLAKSQDLTQTCASFQNQLKKVRSVVDDVIGTLLHSKHPRHQSSRSEC